MFNFTEREGVCVCVCVCVCVEEKGGVNLYSIATDSDLGPIKVFRIQNGLFRFTLLRWIHTLK